MKRIALIIGGLLVGHLAADNFIFLKPETPSAPTMQAPVRPAPAATSPIVVPRVEVAPVETAGDEVEVREVPTPKPQHQGPDYWIQAGSFDTKANAVALMETLKGEGWSAKVFQRGGFNRVAVGPYQGFSAANQKLGSLKRLIPDAFVTAAGRL